MAVKNYTYDRAELRLFGPVEDELAGQKGVHGLRPDADERLLFAAISRGRESLTCIEPNRSIGSLNGLRDTLLLLIDVQCLIDRNVHFGY